MDEEQKILRVFHVCLGLSRGCGDLRKMKGLSFGRSEMIQKISSLAINRLRFGRISCDVG